MSELRDFTGNEGGDGCLVIAEVAQSHDGSLGTAHAFIDAAARAGAGAVKFQTHIAAAESTPAEPWRVRFSPQDDTRYEYWKRMEFTPAQWQGLSDHAGEAGLIFLSSAFSLEAVELLDGLGMRMWKVASGEVTNDALLHRMASTGRPVLLSSGMSTLAELDTAVEIVRSHGAPVAVFQCATAYPCPPERVGLNLLDVFRARWNCPVGLSDHSATIYAGLAAVALGADLLEVHLTLSRDMFGPDVAASLTPGELAQLVEGARFIATMRDHPVDKDALANEMAEMKGLFQKSVVVRHSLPAGAVLADGDLVAKKPGTGIPAARLGEVVGRQLRRAVDGDHVLTDDDLEGVV